MVLQIHKKLIMEKLKISILISTIFLYHFQGQTTFFPHIYGLHLNIKNFVYPKLLKILKSLNKL